MDPTKNWAYVDFYYADLRLPECSGIYAVFAARQGRDICIYVGQSKNLKSRWSQHGKTLACLREGADFIRYSSMALQDLDSNEIELIKYFQPCLNSHHT
jgi:excinuclease UvrABC nuclease subunit